ncbi:MAG: alkaline phosphatase family protein [Anaerolineales bacterium]|jgi:phospholipase C
MIRQKFFAVVLAVFLGASQLGLANPPSSTNSPQATTPIQHLVVLMQENHTFDNYFGTYPGANGLPTDAKMPVDPTNPNSAMVLPWHIGNTTITDLSHNAPTFLAQYDSGKMDGFVSALNKLNQNGQLSMGFYDYRDIPYYWNLASNYVLFDNFFSSAKDGSAANHMYWIAGVSPTPKHGQTLSDLLTNLPTIFDRLQAAGVSWKFYVENYNPNVNYRNMASQGNKGSQVIWVPLLNFDRFIDDPTLASHIVDLSQYYVDLRNGTLPAVSYIVPSGTSEHPPEYPATGERQVKNLVQELMRSSVWNSSAFMVLYDDWGGWYDHVVPPQVDAYGYGLRVPALLVSPFAKAGYIDNTQLDFTSVLKFIEDNWKVASLSTRDAAANNFLGAFNFSQAPRQAVFLSSTWALAVIAKKSPTFIIYASYGLAFLVSIIVFGFAILKRGPKVLTQEKMTR